MLLSAWLKNAPWNFCLFAALIVLGIADKALSAQTQPAIFPIPTQISVPGTPLFTGDFDGDGVPDLAYNQGNVTIVLDFAGSAPTIKTTALCSGGTNQIAFADVNNDKKLDAVFVCNSYLGVAFGNGDGTFQATAFYAVNTETPLLVDLNG